MTLIVAKRKRATWAALVGYSVVMKSVYVRFICRGVTSLRVRLKVSLR